MSLQLELTASSGTSKFSRCDLKRVERTISNARSADLPRKVIALWITVGASDFLKLDHSSRDPYRPLLRWAKDRLEVVGLIPVEVRDDDQLRCFLLRDQLSDMQVVLPLGYAFDALSAFSDRNAGWPSVDVR
ncbi:hypothetical protein NKI72_19625 [Mesorhizobium sp. M0437]|uniref:hypothetical protein n=1 Tax=Mesorhizobium sp. M0437 TaxID=2956945 RepID=UPI0033374188